MGGWVSSCTDFTFTFTFTLHYITYTLFSFDDGGFVLLVVLLVLLLLWTFLLGTIFKEKSSYNPAKKIPGKATKFPGAVVLGVLHYLPSEFHFVFLVVNTGILVVTKRRRMRRERGKKRRIFNLLTC